MPDAGARDTGLAAVPALGPGEPSGHVLLAMLRLAALDLSGEPASAGDVLVEARGRIEELPPGFAFDSHGTAPGELLAGLAAAGLGNEAFIFC